jgi:Flp pilus assembly protein TadG
VALGTSKERGAAMVEMALILPILFLLCFGVLEYGYRFMKQSELNNFAYIAARHYSIHDAPSADIAAKLTAAKPNPGDADPAIVYGTVCPEVVDEHNAIVDITVKWPSVTGLLGFLPGINGDGTVDYKAHGEARCDG